MYDPNDPDYRDWKQDTIDEIEMRERRAAWAELERRREAETEADDAGQ